LGRGPEWLSGEITFCRLGGKNYHTGSVIFINENKNENGEKRETNELVNEN